MVWVHLDHRGVIGRHDAVVAQLLVVVAGGVEVAIGPGCAALWAAGESHQTRSRGGLTAVVIEAQVLELAATLA